MAPLGPQDVPMDPAASLMYSDGECLAYRSDRFVSIQTDGLVPECFRKIAPLRVKVV